MSELEAGRRLLSWLSDLQRSGSVTVLAIDDAQWLDGASARALRFALRRLRVDRVLTVMARRTSTVPAVENWTGDPAATTWLRPRPLSSEQVRELVHRGRSWKLSVEESDRLTHRTAGLPLLVSALVGSARSPRDLDVEGDLPTSVATAVMRLFGAVDEPARRLVEASAVLGEAVPLVVLGQLAPTPDVFEAAEQARVAGLLRVAHDRTFGCTHALLQEAVYDAIPLGRRRDLHARAATCTTGERRLTHRTLAADRPDPDLVVDLVAAADALRGTHSFRRAADLRLKARDVSGDAEQRDELLLEALVDLVSAQDLLGARSLAEQAERHPSSPLRDLALGVLARESGEVDTAKVLLQRALDGAVASETRDIRDRSAMALTYLLALVNAGRPVVDAAEWALHSPDPEVSADAANLKAMALWWCGDLEEALDGLGTRPARQHTEPVEAELLAGRGLLKMYTGRLQEALEDLDATIALAPVWRPSVTESRFYFLRSTIRFLLGQWDEAAVDATAARTLAEQRGTSWNIPLACAVSMQVRSWRGEWDLAEEYLARAREGLATLSTQNIADIVFEQEVVLASARGDDESVLGLLGSRDDVFWERLSRTRTQRSLMQLWMRACFAVGDVRQAELVLRRYERSLERWPGGPVPSRLGWMRGRLAEVHGRPQEARVHYAEDLRDPATADVPFVRAQLLQASGELEHALGDRAEGAARLLEAASVFTRLRAEPSLEDCRATLASWGVRTHVTGPSELTPREQDVCTLVLAGRTNREVAAELFLTTKTVEFHLHNVYAKLGVAGRQELRRRHGDVVPGQRRQQRGLS